MRPAPVIESWDAHRRAVGQYRQVTVATCGAGRPRTVDQCLPRPTGLAELAGHEPFPTSVRLGRLSTNSGTLNSTTDIESSSRDPAGWSGPTGSYVAGARHGR
jgi:hypothetical protein